MTRNLKLPGLAVVAALALSALTASPAQATEFFHSHKENTIYTGEGTSSQVFEMLPNEKISCATAQVEGTETGMKTKAPSARPTQRNHSQ